MLTRPPNKTTLGKLPLTKRLVMGILGASTVAIIGSAGMAAAATGQSVQPPASKADCKMHWQALGFKNQGQCISWWEHNVAGHGYGYGGQSTVNSNNDTSINTNANVNVKGNHNVVSFVVSYLFGH
jgi:hypothetical protein